VGDYIAIPARLPVVEKDITQFNIAEHLIQASSSEELWEFARCRCSSDCGSP
jgi:hypothetical protein